MAPVSHTDSATLPDWLDAGFFQDVFANQDKYQGKELQLRIIEGGSVVNPGENFLAQMYRVKVECKTSDDQVDTASFIVKVGKSDVEFLKKNNFFATEYDMYSSIIRIFEEMWQKIGEQVAFGPK